jgi:hypothetical protein
MPSILKKYKRPSSKMIFFIVFFLGEEHNKCLVSISKKIHDIILAVASRFLATRSKSVSDVAPDWIWIYVDPGGQN